MQRDLLLLGEIVEAAERLKALTDGLSVEDIEEDNLLGDEPPATSRCERPRMDSVSPSGR